jgi:ech hydrogenase subunit C
LSGIERSPWLIHYDASSCNGCDIEVLACLTPMYDAERFGCIVTDVVRTIYEQMPDPKAVVAIGACAYSGGVFAECYNVQGGVAKVIPVDVYVPGCAAKPESILDGVIRAAQILAEKRADMKVERRAARRRKVEGGRA